MIEALVTIAIIGLAFAGLGLGLLLGRGPALTSCSAAANRPEGPCADCPLRKRVDGETSQ